MKEVKNEGGWTSEGMNGDLSLVAAVLAVVSVVSLSLLSILCLRCKKKSTTIHEESQIYDPQIFQRGGSKFAVMRSKTVTRANPMSSPSDSLNNKEQLFSRDTPEENQFQDAQTEEQDYENVSVQTISSSLEHDYVAPIAVSLYENEKSHLAEAEQNPGLYGNVFPSLSITEDDDYENAEFLEQQESDEPDYVNENGEST
ncbi:LAT2 domain-containing protein isoform X3 [Cyprinodon tularosa]|uniref:LAT2 domain-containing protein isoform X3 n=1 Tax=Cyprinodon tularosa TaxID=77115 RepID=UPI0018E2460A|nr:LAT2 domain-containing protein isoform X3 [Cyprinodon tularosa]